MLLEVLLHLRRGDAPVAVIQREGQNRPELGTAYPYDEDVRRSTLPALWGLLPEKTDPVPVVPEWPQFLEGCIRYRRSLDEQAPSAPRTKDRVE